MNGVNFALQYSQQVLAELSSLLKHPYQLAKLDLAAVPDHEAGAMENWGLVIANRKNLLYTPGVTAARAHQSISNLIAHELTHKWFGNEVTPELWQYLWLSEGLARYFEFYAASRVSECIFVVFNRSNTTFPPFFRLSHRGGFGNNL